MNTEPLRTHRQIEIGVCEDDLFRLADEWNIFLSSESSKHTNYPDLLREAVEAKWKEYTFLTDNHPKPKVKERIESIPLISLPS